MNRYGPITAQELIIRGIDYDTLDTLMDRARIYLDARLNGLRLTRRLITQDATLTLEQIIQAANFIAANPDTLKAIEVNATLPICGTPTERKGSEGLPDSRRGECTGPLPGRNVTVVQTGDKTLFVTNQISPVQREAKKEFE